jgi:plasmid stabilization system protein ParE
MPRGDKSAYTDKQKRKAEHIEEGYEKRGLSEDEAERRAWATVNAMDHGGKKSGSGRGKRTNKAPARKGGRKGAAARSRSTSARKTSARKTSARKTARTSSKKK